MALQAPVTLQDAKMFLGRSILKPWPVDGTMQNFEGVVKGVTDDWKDPETNKRSRKLLFTIRYPADGDREDLLWEELSKYLVPLATDEQPAEAPSRQKSGNSSKHASVDKEGSSPVTEDVPPSSKRSKHASTTRPERRPLAEKNHEDIQNRPAEADKAKRIQTPKTANKQHKPSKQHTQQQQTQQQPTPRQPTQQQPAQEQQHRDPARAATPAQAAAAPQAEDPDLDERSTAAKCRSKGEPGQLKRIVLQNFMCHAHFELEFGPHVTLVSGSNGSGKSAVMQGLQACLGVSARETGRSKQLGEFITTGADSALVKVTLWNEGVEAYKHELYGDEITIERVIRRSGGGYKLYGWHGPGRGRPCSNKKDDVDAVLEYFCINAANPLTVITQDMARTFLNGDVHGKRFKYQMYLEGTMLGEIGSYNKSSVTYLRQGADLLKSHDEEFRTKKQALEQLEQELQRLKDMERQRSVVSHMEVVSMWQAIRQMVSKADETQAEVQQLQADAGNCDTRVTALQEEKDQVQQEIRDKRAMLERAVDESSRVQAALQELKLQQQQRAQERKVAQQKYTEASNVLKDLHARRDDLEQELTQSTQGNSSGKVEEAKRKLAEFEQKMHQQAAQLEAVDAEFNRKRDEETAEKEQLEGWSRQLDTEVRQQGRLQDELNQYLQQLNEVRASATNNAAKFGGQSVVHLLNALKHNNTFRFPPLGPVGAFLGLTDQRWSRAIEVALGGSLNRFICFDTQDCKALSQLGRQNRMTVNSTAVKRGIPRHQVPRRQEQAGLQYPSVMDVVRINHPDPAMVDVIFNWLVDTCKIESTLLVDNRVQGEALVYSHNPEYNQFTAVDAEGVTYKNTSGTVTVRAAYNNLMPRLGLDTSEMCAQLDGMVADKRQELETQQAQVTRTRQHLQALNQSCKGLFNECTQLAVRRNQLKRGLMAFQHQRDELLPALGEHAGEEEQQLLVATQMIAGVKADICTTQLTYQECEAALTAAQQAERDAKQAIADKKAATQMDYGGLSEEIESLAGREAQLQRRIAQVQDTARQVAAAVTEKQQLLQNLERDRQEASALAAQLCPEEEVAECEAQVRQYFRSKYADSKAGRQAQKAQKAAAAAGATQAGAGDAEADAGAGVNAEMEAWVEKCLDQQVLAKEAARLNHQVEEAERAAGGNEAELEHELDKARHLYEKRLVITRAVQERLAILQRACNSRLESYAKLQKAVKQVASNSFCRFMARRQHIGLLEVDDERAELNLRVKVKGKTDPTTKWVDDLKQLSGGERSYTSVSLLLALGQWSESPFRCLDEFDVFMDPVNRRVATEALLQFALDYSSRQYVLLTPQDTEAVMSAYRHLEAKLGETLPASFLKVVTMKPARAQPAA